MLLSSTLRNALLPVAVLLPAHVLADDEDDSVTFGFSDCVSTCVATTGYSMDGEANQKVMCTATRDGLLEAVMACMVSDCSGGLSNVASDLLGPMETGCEEVEMPIDAEDTQEAASVAASIEATAVVTSSTITTASTSIEMLQTISTTTESPIPQLTTPTPEVQTSLIGITTTLDPVVLVTTTAQVTTTPKQPPQVVTSAIASNTTSAVGIVPVEQQLTSVLSAVLTLETATLATTEFTPVLSSSAPSTPSASITNRLSLVQQEPATTRATTMAIPSTTGGEIPSVHPDATKKAEAKSATASAEKTIQAIETEASKTGDATTRATTISSSAPGPESATSATDSGSALEMATGSPTATITSGFATSTSSGPSMATASNTGSSSSSEATDDAGTGDPFSIVTDSAAAAAAPPRGSLSLVFSAVPVAMAVLASVL